MLFVFPSAFQNENKEKGQNELQEVRTNGPIPDVDHELDEEYEEEELDDSRQIPENASSGEAL